MVWWLFKKREEHPEHTHLKSKIDSLDINVKNSFSNIRKDILHLFSKLDKHEKEIFTLRQKLLSLHKNKQVEETNEILKQAEIISPDLSKPKFSWEDLTTVQQTLFKNLAVLQIESSQKWVAMKTLAEELYPNKSYDSVRSMISDYIHLLVDMGLVKKMRKRRQVYLSLSSLGTKFFDKTKQRKIIQILEKQSD